MPRKQKVNRAEQVSEKNKNYDFNVDLYSIDEAVKYYIDNVIMPKVHTIDEELDVPVIYASMERWSNIQKTQYIRNDKNKVMCPIIAYKRTGVEKNSDISVSKIDANKPQIHYFRKQKFNNKFRYNKFNLLHDQRRPEEIISMVVPEYVILSYDMIFWTDYIQQMNELIETFKYYEGSYWGEDKYKFRTKIDSGFSDNIELSSGGKRLIKNSCSLTINGYFIPKIFNKEKLVKKQYGASKVIYTESVVDDL